MPDYKAKYQKYKEKYRRSKLQKGGAVNWGNKNAEKKLVELTKILGEPDIKVEKDKGLAIWLKDTLAGKDIGYGPNCFEEIIVRDERIKHLCPREHDDFLYSYVKVPVHPPSKLPAILSLSGSVGYDALKNLLHARCASLEANIVTLKIATDILSNKSTEIALPDGKKLKYQNIEDVHSADVYGQMITATGAANNVDYLKNLYQSLCDNVEELQKQGKDKMNLGYWKGAFSRNENTCYPPDKADKICLETTEKKASRGDVDKAVLETTEKKPLHGSADKIILETTDTTKRSLYGGADKVVF